MTVTMIWEHLYLVIVSILFTILLGIPIGTMAYYFPKLRKYILSGVEVLQTIPAMALLGLIMVLLGAGKPTVIVGLVLYSLLPVVLNTYVGFSGIDPALKEAATGMGMSRSIRLFRIELPLAFPLIFTGIRIATVTAISVAVFASLVGGGGLGKVFFQGIRISDFRMIWEGTLVLMLMAVFFDGIMALIERYLRRRLLGERRKMKGVL